MSHHVFPLSLVLLLFALDLTTAPCLAQPQAVPIRDADWDFWSAPPHLSSIPTGNVGIGTAAPVDKLHVSDVLRLEPRATAPDPASEGDLYVDSTDHHIYCYLDGGWKQLDS